MTVSFATAIDEKGGADPTAHWPPSRRPDRSRSELASVWTAELERLRARAVLALNLCGCDVAEASLRAAVGDARRCSARLFELRAAIDLARLWMHQNRRAEAYEQLATAYGAFTEGFHTSDLASARSLLDELGPGSNTIDVAS